MGYVGVRIQFEVQSEGDLMEFARNAGVTDADGMVRLIEDIDDAAERHPRLPTPTYIDDGDNLRRGDVVRVPYGKNFFPIGVVVGESAPEDGITYKPIRNIVARATDYSE